MGLAMQHASSPDWWLGTMAASVGLFLEGKLDEDDLRREYDRLLRSPLMAADPEFRAALPKRPHPRVKARRVK